jgi:hypothetical protein
MEIIKKLEEIEAEITRRFNRLILETEKAAKEIIREIAYDTGDMEFAVSHKLARKEGGDLIGEIFVDPGKLYNKRKPYQYKTGDRAGSYAMPVRKYPIYVHAGNPNMKARPYFNLAWDSVRQRPEFLDFAKDIILKEAI